MVTQNETDVSSEVESSPEAEASLPVADEPLIPADFDDRFDQAEAATEEEATTGDEATSDDSESQPEETSETTEETPTAETEETPEATTTEETEQPEGEQPEGRNRTDDEWNKRESSYRQREAELQKQITDMQTQVTQLQSTYSDSVLDAEVRGYAQSLQAQLVAEGHDDAAAERLASQQANAAKAAYQAQQQSQQLQQQLMQQQQSSEEISRRASVDRLMIEHSVPEEHRDLLLGYSDPTLAVKAAQTLGAAEQLKTETKTARLAEVPSGGEANQLDSGTGGSGTETDSQWLDKYNAGLYDSPADDLRASKILASRGINLQFR